MKAKHDDPKVLKLRSARDAASIRVEVLTKGLAETLKNGYWMSVEDIKPIVDLVNGDLIVAMQEYERAIEAYRPFMARRRIHRFNPRRAA